MSAKPPLMTPGEVADAFQVNLQTVARWRKTGKLASIPLLSGRDHRFFRREVEAILRGEPLTAGQLAEVRAQALDDSQ